MAILREDSYSIALLDTQRSHGISVPPGPLGKLVVRESMRAANDGFLIAVNSERSLEEIQLVKRNYH
jgi:hypothetical protein